MNKSVLFIIMTFSILWSCSKYDGTLDEQLVLAVKAGDIEYVQKLINKGADPDAILGPETRIMHAAYFAGNKELF